MFVYLNAGRAQGLSFKWGVVDLRETLGNLCRSHNESIDRIQANAVLKTDYRAGEADLRFCAILLRLADILDFDRSRSPDSVYQYLGLKRPRRHRARRQATSSGESTSRQKASSFRTTGAPATRSTSSPDPTIPRSSTTSASFSM